MGEHVYFSREFVSAPFNPLPTAVAVSHAYTVAWTSPVYCPDTNKLFYAPRCFDPAELAAFNTPYNYFLVFDLNTNTVSQLDITETPPNSYGWRFAKGAKHRDGKIYFPMATGVDKWLVLDPVDLSYEMLTTFQISNGLVASPTISDNSQMVSIGVSSMLGEVFFAPCGSAFSKVMKINLAGKLENVGDVPVGKKYYDGVLLKDGSIVFKQHTITTSSIMKVVPSNGDISELSYSIRSSAASPHTLFWPMMIASKTTNTFTCGKNGDGAYMEVCDLTQKVQVSNTIWTSSSECGYCSALSPNDLFVEFPGWTGTNNSKYCDYDLSLGLG